MRSFFCFVEIISGSPGNHIFLMYQIILQHIQKIKYPRLIIYKSQHDDSKCILQLCMLVKLIQDHRRTDVFTQLNVDSHTFAAGFISDISNSVYLFFFYQVRNFFDQTRLIDHIRKFRHNNPVLSIGHRFYTSNRTHADLSSSRTIRFIDPRRTKDLRAGWKIRTLHNIQNFLNRSISVLINSVFNDLHHSRDDFPKIMRRNIGRHTHSDTGSTIYQKIRKSGREHRRLFLCLVKVRYKIHGIFVNIREHFHGYFTQAGFRITHSRRPISIHGSKISVTVYQWITGRPLLGHIYQSAIDRTVSMRMIFTHGITYDTRAFTMRLIGTVIQFNHGVQHPALHRLQTVSYIRKSPGSDYAHGVVDIGSLHSLLQIHIMNLVKNIVFHSFIPII